MIIEEKIMKKELLMIKHLILIKYIRFHGGGQMY